MSNQVGASRFASGPVGIVDRAWPRAVLALAVVLSALSIVTFATSPKAEAAVPTPTPTTLLNEPFTSSGTLNNAWQRYLPSNDIGGECHTVDQTGPFPKCNADTVTNGSGALRINGPYFGGKGQAFAKTVVSPDAGLVINFDLNQWGAPGTGGWTQDRIGSGTVMVLAATDPDNPAPPTRYGSGGVELGYAGMDKTYMGFASDITGNFPVARSPFYDSCPTGSGYGGRGVTWSGETSSLSARGPGDYNGTTYTGYCYLGAMSQGSQDDWNWRWVANGVTPAPSPVEVVLNPSANPIDMPKGYTVPAYGWGMWQRPMPGRSGADVVITGQLPRGTAAARGGLAGGNYPASWINDRTQLPKALTLGFAGWGYTAAGNERFAYKQISNLKVTTLFDQKSTYTLALSDSNAGQLIAGDTGSVFTITPTLSGNPDQNSPTLTTTFPIGVTPPAWSNYATGNGYTCTRGATSPYTVTCSYSPVAPLAWPISPGALPTLSIPVDGTPGTYQVTTKLTSASTDAAGVTANRTITLTKPALQLSAPSVPYGSALVATVPGLPTNARGSIVYAAHPAGGAADGSDDIDLCVKTFPTEGSTVALADTRCDITTALPVGSYTIRATWDDGATAPFAQHVYTEPLTITKATTQLTATTSTASTTYGTPVTITATLLPKAADGTVLTFLSGTSKVCDDAVLPTTSCITYADLAPGTYPVTVSFSGDDNTKAATASTSFTITKADVAIAAAADPTTVEAGKASTLSVSGLPREATGTVKFMEGSTELCRVTHTTAPSGTDPDHVWACATDPTLSKGIHTVVAQYSGDSNFRAANSSFFALNVTAQSTPSSITGSDVTVPYGTRATLTVSGLPADATGSVSFLDGGTLLCKIANVAPATTGGPMRTSCQTSATVPVGVYDNVIADYSGDPKYLGSTSQPFTVTVTKLIPTVATAVSPSSVVYGSPVTVTATGLASDATGTLTFTSGGQTLCIATLPATSCTVAKTLPAGSYPVAVAYSGGGNYAAASGGTASFTVTMTGAAFSAAASPSGTAYGNDVVLSVSGLPANPTGTVVFTSGSTTLCTADLATTAACAVTRPDAGTYPVLATWTNNGETTTANTAFTVTKSPTTLTVSAPASVSYGTKPTLAVGGLPVGASGPVAFKDETGETLCTVADVSVTTSCVADTHPAVGTHQVTAHWGGNTNHGADTSDPGSFTVAKVATTVSAAANPATVSYGNSSTLIATGLPATATGTVTFTAGAATLCEITLPTDPAACTTAADLAPGTYSVVAAYSGDANLKASSSSPIVLKVTKQSLGTTMTASATNTSYGFSSTLTAVLPADATGTVTFTSAGKVLCSYDAATETSCQSPADLAAGPHAVSAAYTGDGSYSAATATTNFTVAKIDPSGGGTGLTGSATPAMIALGQQSQLAVGNLAAGVEGSVVFTDAKDAVLCTIPDVTLARSCVTSTTLGQGSYVVHATYSGDAGHAAATSDTFELTVNAGPAPVSMTTTITPETIGYGDRATLSVTGLPAGATGRVDFKDGSLLLCSVTLPATACQSSSNLEVGSYSVVASYSGDTAYAPGQAAPQPLTLTKTDVTIGSFANPDSVGQGSSTSVGVTGLPSGATGTITFTTTVNGAATTLCTATLPATTCATPATLTQGSYPVRAAYSGDAHYRPAAVADSTLTVTAPPATPKLVASAAPAVADFGTPVNLAVTGLAADATGQVTFTIPDGSGGTTQLCTIADLTTANSCDTAANLAVGTYQATATYAGNKPVETATVSFTIRKAATTLTGAASPASVVKGATVTLTAGGLPVGATGQLRFESAGTLLCVVDVATANSCDTPGNLAVGSYQVTASWSGDARHQGSTSPVFTFEVTKKPSSLTLSVTPDSVPFDSSASLVISGLPDAATGTVTIADSDGPLCQLTLPETSCTTAANASVGGHTLRAAYGGDSAFASSTSAPVLWTVTKAPVALATYANPGTVGEGASAAVGATGLPARATGTLVFTSGGAALCTATLPATSCATPTTVTPGTYDVSVSYSGDVNVAAGSGDGGVLTVTDVPPASTLTASAAPSSVAFGTPVNLAVTGLASGATGQVTFTSGSTVLCTIADVAQTPGCTTSRSLPVGSYAVTAAYAGDAKNQAELAATSFTVTEAGSSLTAAATPSTVVYGSASTLSIGGLPANASGSVTFLSGGDVLCTIANVADSTSCATSPALGVGSYVVVARWAGDAGHAAASTNSFGLTVVKQSSTSAMAVTATPDSVPYGTPSTLAVTGLPSSATGDVTFTYAGRTLCTATLPTTSCLSEAGLGAGIYTVRATYSGDRLNDPATATTTLQVTKVSTEITASAGPAVIARGETSALRVAGLDGGATGDVTFTVAGTSSVLCTIADVTTTRSCLTSKLLAVGSYTVVAHYGGDAGRLPSTAESFTLTVNPGPAPISFTAAVSAASVNYGQAVTLSVTGFPADSTGQVSFTDGRTGLCTITLPATSCVTGSRLEVGDHQVTATYSGDSSFAPGVADAVSFSVVKVQSAVTSFANPGTVIAGGTAELGASGLPAGATGTLVFSSGATALCTAALPAITCASPSSLAAGSYPVTVAYSGDAHFLAATGAGGTLTVEAPPVTVTPTPTQSATPTDNPTATANPTVTVTPTATTGPTTGPSSGTAPAVSKLAVTTAPGSATYGTPISVAISGLLAGASGKVTVMSGDVVLCTIDNVADRSGCLTAATLAPGNYPLTVTYAGDANNPRQQAESSFAIAKAEVSLSGESLPRSIVYGRQAVLSGGTLPTGATGTITFRAGTSVLCTATLPATTCATSRTLSAGVLAITATYSGDARFGADSSESFSLTINRRGVDVRGVVKQTRVRRGGYADFFVTGIPAGAKGVIRFRVAANKVCTVTLPSTTCRARVWNLRGHKAVIASYSGDRNHRGDRGWDTLRVFRRR